MATELQTDLYRKNEQFAYLSELMSQNIYPRLIEALKKLGMEEVRFEEINGWRTLCITLTGKIQFFSIEDKLKKNIYELDFSGKKECPLFSKNSNKNTTEYESPFPKYKIYCETIINKLEELERNFVDASELISRIENMGVSLQRKVMIEKHKNGKKN